MDILEYGCQKNVSGQSLDINWKHLEGLLLNNDVSYDLSSPGRTLFSEEAKADNINELKLADLSMLRNVLFVSWHESCPYNNKPPRVVSIDNDKAS